MSGIAGVFQRDGAPVERTAAERMTAALIHRGPDAGATVVADPVALGHRALWTTPEARGEALPITVGTLTITADARLDNRDELIGALGLGGAGRGAGDATLILHAYDTWGEECPARLL